MAQKPKVNEILIGLGLLTLGVLVLVFTMGLALLPPGGASYQVHSPLFGTYQVNSLSLGSALANAMLWFFMPIPALFAFEGGLWRLHQGVKIREDKLKSQRETFWSKIAVFDQFIDLFNTVLFIIFLLLLITGSVYELSHLPKKLSVNIVIYAFTIFAYILIRKKLVKGLVSTSKLLRKGAPTYKLTEDGITIKLVAMWNKKQANPPPVHIRFDEIEQLEVFSYVEAEAFLEYEVGPDLQLSVRQTKDFVRYVKGEIPRPSVYAFGSSGSGLDKRVLISGPELFYMITFENEDISDLLDAYSSFKALTGMTGAD